MAYRFDISIPLGEKELNNWIRKRMENNEITPSLVFRDAMLEKKAEFDAIHTENPKLLHKKIDDLKQTVGLQSAFIGAKKERKEDWFNFFENNGNNDLKQKHKGGITELIEPNIEKIEELKNDIPPYPKG